MLPCRHDYAVHDALIFFMPVAAAILPRHAVYAAYAMPL